MVECLTLLTVTNSEHTYAHTGQLELAPKPLLRAGKIVIYVNLRLSQIAFTQYMHHVQ